MTGRELTESYEGRRSRVYVDTKGKRTIGVGFNMQAPGSRTTWEKALPGILFDDCFSGKIALSDAQVDELFEFTYRRAQAQGALLTQNYEALPQAVRDVVTDMVFQLGARGFSMFVRMRGALGKGDLKFAAECMRQSLWAEQVPNRAAANIAILLKAAELAQKSSATA